MKFNFKSSIFKKILLSLILVVFLSSAGIALTAKPVEAAWPATVVADAWGVFRLALDKTWDAIKVATQKAGSSMFAGALRTTLNKMAYESATYLATGNEGQKPTWYGEGFGPFLENVGDNAFGYYIEKLGKEWSPNFNLCEPSLDLKMKIGLGLTAYKVPKEPECTFSEMVKAWETEADRWKDMSSDDYLQKLSTMFDPTGNDLSIAMNLMIGAATEEELKEEEAERDRFESEGWLDIRNIAGIRETFPGFAKEEAGALKDGATIGNVAKYTGDALIDAANIFLNQYAITLINKKLRELGSGGNSSQTSPYNWDNLSSSDATSVSVGIKQVRENLKELVEPKIFSTQSSYDILAELSSCPDLDMVGPNNCVIDNEFKEAITRKLTVKEAIDQGYLDRNKTVGFLSDGSEPKYNEGYPYRSLIILRKFRILPVGWELAGEYIKDNPEKIARMTLGELVDCYGTTDWCGDLIDPDWVLKAPLNYCNRQGYGSEIIDSQIVKVNEDDFQLSIYRSDDYCADEQSCIDENDDGTCNYYGYCVEEKRKWNFSSDSCEPEYNTCQTFINKESGRSFSFLENTLEYCSQDAAGCKDYCSAYDYNAQSFVCSSDSDEDKIYFNNSIDECEASAEGCHEFIRTKDGSGANLLLNSSFEEGENAWDFSVGFGEVGISTEQNYFGSNSLKINHDDTAGQFSSATQFVSGIVGQEKITVSYYVRTEYDQNGPYQGAWLAVSALDEFGNILADMDPRYTDENDYIQASVIRNTWDGEGVWKRIIISFITPDYTTELKIQPRVENISAVAYFDAIKVEKGEQASPYNEYRASGLVYQKLIPNYLEDLCYTTDYQLRSDAPAECGNYVRYCNESEVGCEMYTSQTTAQSIPAKTSPTDYCEAECVGYNTYIQNESIFDSKSAEYFIPATAETCSAAFAGCDEFTNLNEVGAGGEAREYYKYLRQCSLPNEANCADFYTWEGDDEAGYQLSYFTLKEDPNDNSPYLVNTGKYDGKECNSADDYDPINNPDCREFFDTQGNIHYKFYHYTVTCSENCQPYRRTKINIDYGLRDSASCSAIGSGFDGVNDEQFYWDDNSELCYFCKNGGEWVDQYGACIYMAIPGEGESCDASQNGCREYSGNTGGNYRIVADWNFNNNTTEGWTGVGETGISLSNESLTTVGQSLAVAGGSPQEISINLGTLINESSAYNLNFLAKSFSVANLEICLQNNSADNQNEVCFNQYENGDALPSILITPEWGQYSAHIDLKDYYLQHEVSADEKLIIRSSSAFFIDNIRLTEVIDRYYLIEDSWNTPNSCNQNIYGEYEPWHDLGCDFYKDREGGNHYLHNFSELCQESGVGCEIMIDTHNYSDYQANEWIKGSWSIGVPADNVVYAVYDKNKTCNNDDKGCQLLGSSYGYMDEEIYSASYYVNNPDRYNSALCSQGDVGCEIWNMECSSVENGACASNVVFKDPGSMTCEYRVGTLMSGEAWYKTKVRRCADGTIGGGDICQTYNDCPAVGALECANDNDCATGKCFYGECYYECTVNEEAPDEFCPYTTLSTIGYGNQKIYQPAPDVSGNTYSNWVGLCPAQSAGCAEYIDPISSFSENLIINGNFSQDADKDNNADSWNSERKQFFNLEKYTLYVFSVTARNSGEITATVSVPNGNFYIFDEYFPGSQDYDSISITARNGERKSIRFYTNNVNSGEIYVSNANVNSGNKVEVKKVIVNYRLRQDVDRTSCPDNQVNFSEGCVLFNERVQSGNNNKKPLIFDADRSDYYAGEDEEKDANVLLKVDPDRACGEWLACGSYSLNEESDDYFSTGNPEVICVDRTLCDRLNDEGKCEHFVPAEKETQSYPSNISSDDIKNMSGYTKVGWGDGSLNSEYYSVATMDQVGTFVDFRNGNFEIYNNNFYPSGWKPFNYSTGFDEVWTKSKFMVIDSPHQALEVEGVNYTSEGKGFLKYAPEWGGVRSELIRVEGGSDYVLSGIINTMNFHPEDHNWQAGVVVETYNSAGSKINGITSGTGRIALAPGRSWTKITEKIRLSPSVSKIHISIKPVNNNYANYTGVDFGGIGTVYVDNIIFSPGLEKNDQDLIAPSCRLYPEQSSLACEYIGESGVTLSGWYGYCLEYDRYPGNSNTCLMWYPVDKVRSQESGEKGSDYQGRYPLYYCEEARMLIPVEYRHLFYIGYSCPGNITWAPAETDYNMNWVEAGSCGWDSTPGDHHYYSPKGNNLLVSAEHSDSYDNRTWHTDGWYPYNGILNHPLDPYSELEQGIKYYDPITGKLYDDVFAYCETITMTVDETKANAYWRSRVYSGSNYTLPSGVGYATSYPPFGSIPEPNKQPPTTWDGSSESSIQPLYVHNEEHLELGSVNAGFPTNFNYNNPYYVYNYYNLTKVGRCSNSTRPCLIVYTDDTLATKVSPDKNLADCQAGEGNCVIISQSTNGANYLKRIFAQSYGHWKWNNDLREYENIFGIEWEPPTNLCSGTPPVRPTTYSDDWCGVPPLITNIRVNNQSGDYIILGSASINLTFNSKVDAQQLPLIEYAVDWGDSRIFSSYGTINDRPVADFPHSVTQNYSFYDIKNRIESDTDIYCGLVGELAVNDNGANIGKICTEADCCMVQPAVKIQDNWGWCNKEEESGAEPGPCPSGGYQRYGGWIIVYEE